MLVHRESNIVLQYWSIFMHIIQRGLIDLTTLSSLSTFQPTQKWYLYVQIHYNCPRIELLRVDKSEKVVVGKHNHLESAFW